MKVFTGRKKLWFKHIVNSSISQSNHFKALWLSTAPSSLPAATEPWPCHFLAGLLCVPFSRAVPDPEPAPSATRNSSWDQGNHPLHASQLLAPSFRPQTYLTGWSDKSLREMDSQTPRRPRILNSYRYLTNTVLELRTEQVSLEKLPTESLASLVNTRRLL